MRGVDGTCRFLASLKLAVLSLGALAGTLAYATFFETWYSTAAVNEYIYRGPYFAVLLALLGTNIFCAALIRYPWKLRQTGFVITHAGLLIVLAGSFYSVRTSDEGQVGMREGDVRNELVRVDHPVIRIWQMDPHTQQYTREFELPFLPGSFSWGPGHPRHAGLVGWLVSRLPFGGNRSPDVPGETLTRSGEPFRVVAKEYLTASAPAREHVGEADGMPMARSFVPIELPPGKMDQGIAACRLEMTVGDETKEIWLRRSATLERPRPEVVSFRDSDYALAFDADRKRLGFDLELDDFEVGFEPGTQQPTRFESQVRLTDLAAGIRDEPHTIRMNHPLDHNGYSFYQIGYQSDIDPHTERPTGRFLSVFRVAKNPGRPIIYAGCLLVVLGTFVQFTVRAGVFTNRGKNR
jgi:hypothetical protein